ncbi:MAG: prenyltransferase/squalene oxidase repeat-containing protein [Gemmataceae bacterium]
MHPDHHPIGQAYQQALDALLAERTSGGYWVGELSTSALSTAVAVSALSSVDGLRFAPFIQGGLDWLARHQNEDGGWGDTVVSFSNISTTMLCRSAFFIARRADAFAPTLERCEGWLAGRYGKTPAQLAGAVRRRYGKDRTFSVPILMTSALAGLIPWNEVPTLPFELACFPQSWYRFLGLPVVSYALPALIAIGQAVHHHRGSWNPFRRFAIEPSLRVLARIQPGNGGFLEATPLTSFVAMGLASTGRRDHPVVRKCVEFITASRLEDGSWPIDTNLSTWVTSLSINALQTAGELDHLDRREELRSWLLDQQYRERHPFTGAAPGAWGWTPLPGAVPDSDDTPGAILALQALGDDEPSRLAQRRGIDWLLALQNSDGGIPTFCRGWGKLPFDRSGADLTAHTLRAMAKEVRPDIMKKKAFGTIQVDPPWYMTAAEDMLDYLEKHQRDDGSWLPLWFGNQHAPDDINPTYGTARVLAAYRDLNHQESEPAQRGVRWLIDNQNVDGGWGGVRDTPSSVEETALAVEALLDSGHDDAVDRGLAWLVRAVERGELHRPTPIGFYFAKLWYFEKLYPIIFTVSALGSALRKKGRTVSRETQVGVEGS